MLLMQYKSHQFIMFFEFIISFLIILMIRLRSYVENGYHEKENYIRHYKKNNRNKENIIL